MIINVDMINFAAFLYIFRTRKEWPEYFSLGLDDHRRVRRANQSNENGIIVPIKTSVITVNKASFESNGSFESFGSMGEEDALIIVNPNQYTLDDKDII